MDQSDNKRHFDLSGKDEEFINKRGHRVTVTNYRSVVDQLIGEAKERGDFDNLRGQGQPLDLEENPFAGDQQLAYKMLKDNNFTLPWIEDRREVQAEVEALRDKMQHQWKLFGPQVIAMARGGQMAMAERRWAALSSQWGVAIDLLNRRIQAVNYSIPVQQLKLLTLSAEIELARLDIKPTVSAMLAHTQNN